MAGLLLGKSSRSEAHRLLRQGAVRIDDQRPPEGAREIAPRLADRGMHLEMLVHADRQIAEMADALRSFPVPVVIDHAGWPADDRNPKGGMAPLIELVADGDVFVKLSGIYRFTEPPWEDAAALVAALAEANPERCVWGSDWPHIMLGGAAQPDAGALLDAFFDAVTGEAARTAILRDTPAALYRL